MDNSSEIFEDTIDKFEKVYRFLGIDECLKLIEEGKILIDKYCINTEEI